ncbi:bifunctional DNA primase/polymerase [Paracoccus spongiarum]|uniref:Bifunctional DNA primase/polymerase n=1 Tax=Paracoccus spongiarum TaxID=3064387 RepID=A0ABT9JGE4_9RHOB|nr:bifunctional DNA primase/polymerase [Paracoccus sp. 2205BS29-5]MDP5308868.1 bifunctional DNA primase/polymerase [Paracoccus sp. 2205BS29-5]
MAENENPGALAGATGAELHSSAFTDDHSEPGRSYQGTRAERAGLFRKELLKAALSYAAKGLPVFPAMKINGEKKPLVKWGKGTDGHPDLTHRRATTDAATIRAWWAKWPLAMIGMPTGARSGVVVLDIDRKNGVDGLANLRAAGIDPFTMSPVIAKTPSGGLHVFMRYSGPLKNSAGILAEGVDVRGDGGYIVLPPSLPDLSGPEYCWEGGDYGCL